MGVKNELGFVGLEHCGLRQAVWAGWAWTGYAAAHLDWTCCFGLELSEELKMGWTSRLQA